MKTDFFVVGMAGVCGVIDSEKEAEAQPKVKDGQDSEDDSEVEEKREEQPPPKKKNRSGKRPPGKFQSKVLAAEAKIAEAEARALAAEERAAKAEAEVVVQRERARKAEAEALNSNLQLAVLRRVVHMLRPQQAQQHQES